MATAATRAASGPKRATAGERKPVHRDFGLSDAEALDMYYKMLVSRVISEQALKLAFQGAIDVSIPSDGHEAAQIASMRALRPTDPVYLFYRSPPAAYARGMTAREIFLDYFGAADGPSSGGKNLPGHWAKRELNLMSEGLNFAAVRQLPVVLFCENNGVAISVPFEKQSPVRSVADRAVGYAVVGISVDGSDPLQVYRVMREAVEAARAGRGPALIEARCTRLGQHTSQVGEDRGSAEMTAARRHDPIPRFARYLRYFNVLNGSQESAFLKRAEEEVAEAVEFASRAAPPPVEWAFKDVYGDGSQASAVRSNGP